MRHPCIIFGEGLVADGVGESVIADGDGFVVQVDGLLDFVIPDGFANRGAVTADDFAGVRPIGDIGTSFHRINLHINVKCAVNGQFQQPFDFHLRGYADVGAGKAKIGACEIVDVVGCKVPAHFNRPSREEVARFNDVGTVAAVALVEGEGAVG